MEERRDQDPQPGTRAEPIPADAGLSPVQQAHRRYSRHATSCPKCSDIDRGRCETGEQLWRDWTAACDEAYRQLHRATP